MFLLLLALYIVAYLSYRYYSLLFNPSSTLLPKPPSVEEIKIFTSSSLLSAYELSHPTSDYLLLYFHGNNLNITYRNYVVGLAQLMKCNLLLPDYPGYGSSSGYSNISSLEESSLAVYKYALSKKKKIILWGESLGGYAAAYCANYRKAERLVLFNTFSSLQSMIPSFLFTWFSPLDIASLLSSYEGETLIIHSPHDSFIPYSQALRNLSLLPHSTLLTIEGDHSSPLFEKEKLEFLFSWLELPSPNEKEIERWLEEVKRSSG